MDLISIEELQENNREISDNNEAVRQIESEIDLEYALKRLTKRQRRIIELKMEGYNYIEIADRLKISISTIKREMNLLRLKYVNI